MITGNNILKYLLMGSTDNDQDGYWSYSYTKHLLHPHHKPNFDKVYFLMLFCHYFDLPSDEKGSNSKSQNEAGIGSSSLEGDLYRPHSLCFSGCGAVLVFLTTMGCLLKLVHVDESCIQFQDLVQYSLRSGKQQFPAPPYSGLLADSTA